jgi:hypothetical protein
VLGLAGCTFLASVPAACGTSAPPPPAERTGTSAAAIFFTPTPSIGPVPDPEGVPRPVVAVGRDYVYLTNTSGFVAFKYIT